MTHRKGKFTPVGKRTAMVRFIAVFLSLASLAIFATPSFAQNLDILSRKLTAGTVEEKRDALFQIRDLRSEPASKAAMPGLADPSEIVRATAASAVIWLPKADAVKALTPLLADKAVFVRKEAAYALGSVQSSDAAAPLISLLRGEKDLEVKAAAAFGLGGTGEPNAVEPLIAILKGKPKEETEFLRRSAARSIGRIAQILTSSNGYVVTPANFLPDKFKQQRETDLTLKFPQLSNAVTTLGRVLQNNSEADDTRREAAFALGSIGNAAAASVLNGHINSPDPYLAEISKEALLKIGSPLPSN